MSEKEDTPQRVLEVAGPLFAERGFDGVSVRDITRLADSSPAAVNYHFRSKEDLYVETVRHAATSCAAAAPIPAGPTPAPPAERLRAFVGAFIGRLLRPDVPAWHRLLIMRELADPRHGACEQLVRDFIRPTFEQLLGILRDLVAPATPPEQLHLIAGSIIGQCLHYHHARHVIPLLTGRPGPGGADIDRLADHVTAFSLAAIRGLFPNRDKGDRR